MARPIRNTPILYGDDAREFNLAAQQTVPDEVRMQERERIRQSVENFSSFLENIKAI